MQVKSGERNFLVRQYVNQDFYLTNFTRGKRQHIYQRIFYLYRLTEDRVENDQEHFQVDRATGIVRVVRPLDYETSRQHTLKVSGGDGGGDGGGMSIFFLE